MDKSKNKNSIETARIYGVSHKGKCQICRKDIKPKDRVISLALMGLKNDALEVDLPDLPIHETCGLRITILAIDFELKLCHLKMLISGTDGDSYELGDGAE